MVSKEVEREKTKEVETERSKEVGTENGEEMGMKVKDEEIVDTISMGSGAAEAEAGSEVEGSISAMKKYCCI